MFFDRFQSQVTRLFFLSLFLTGVPLVAQAPSPAGTWQGTWESPNGSVYAAVMQLTVTPDGSVDGSIAWTLKDTRRPDLQPKIGANGTEYVHGTYDARCHVLAFAGYKLDDPRQVLGMDHYQLILAPNGAGLGGVTANAEGTGDTWTGMFSLRR
jgi:hypothetical protein